MKTLIATALLTLTASQAFADGFYQDVVGDRSFENEQITSTDTGISYTPLYNKVTSDGKRAMILNEEISRTVYNVTYTPLYLKVTGQAS